MSTNFLTCNSSSSDSNNNRLNRRCRIEIKGWRKRTLYLLFFILILLTTFNLGFVFWIMKILKFTTTGMGPISIMSDGMELSGQTLVLNTLRASRIYSKPGYPISIDSYRNFTINTRDENGFVANNIFIGNDRTVFHVNKLHISDTNGDLIFEADRDHIFVGAETLQLKNDGGIVIKESIQTPLVTSDIGKNIQLESPTRSLDARASEGIWIQSNAGSIETNCYDDIKLYSSDGSIRIDAKDVFMKNLRKSSRMIDEEEDDNENNSKIYQLCSCDSGKLFLAPSESSCFLDENNSYLCS